MKLNLKIISLSVFIIILSVSGCSPYRSRIKEPLTKEVPSAYSVKSGDTVLVASEGMWWEQFNDEKLNALINGAFTNSPDIIQAYERMMQARAIIGVTGSSKGIRLNLDGSVGRKRQSGFFGAETDDTYNLSAAAVYELDIWQKFESRTNAARYDALASEEDLKTLHISIAAQIADLYFFAAEQRAQLELSDQTVASFQDTLERVERRYRGGLVPAIDVYQSRQNLAAAKARRPVFESGLSVTLNALSVLTGRFPDKEIAGNNTIIKEDFPLVDTGLPSQLLQNRPDIRAAMLRLRADDERVASAIADRLPSFSMTGTYGGTSEQLRTILDSPNIFWNMLLQIAIPVIDSGRRKSEVERTESLLRERLSVYYKTVLNAYREVEDALANIKSSDERIIMLNENASAAESAHRLAVERYMQGLTDYLPVLTEQLRLFEAGSSLLSERRNLVSKNIQLVRALGGKWTDEVISTRPVIADIKGEVK